MELRVNAGRQQARRTASFTLIELLVVVAIIALLAAMLLPVINKARGKARQASCLNNLKQLGIAMYMYVDTSREYLPCPTDDLGKKGCWFFAVDPYLLNLQPDSPESRRAAVKQDPIWTTFDSGSRTNWRTIKMNRKLVGNSVEGTGTAVSSANPSGRRITDVTTAATTPLLMDGRCEESGSNPDKQRYDAWETYTGLRHNAAANILFVDAHAELWSRGKPFAGVGGWNQGSTGLDWWVE